MSEYVKPARTREQVQERLQQRSTRETPKPKKGTRRARKQREIAEQER